MRNVREPTTGKIYRDERSEKLYRLESKRNDALRACAEELQVVWPKVWGQTLDSLWDDAMPQAIFDLLESFDNSAVYAAVQAWLATHRGEVLK
jgi:hypothetical protein